VYSNRGASWSGASLRGVGGGASWSRSRTSILGTRVGRGASPLASIVDHTGKVLSATPLTRFVRFERYGLYIAKVSTNTETGSVHILLIFGLVRHVITARVEVERPKKGKSSTSYQNTSSRYVPSTHPNLVSTEPHY
jgi:hypothetical protein